MTEEKKQDGQTPSAGRPHLAVAVAIALGILAALAARSYLKSRAAAVTDEWRTVRVVRAETDIEPGVPLTKAMIEPLELPEKYVSRDNVLGADHGIILGQVLSYPVSKGEPILWSAFETRREGLDSMVQHGERAVTLRVNEITGLAGMLSPNDRVDVLATFAVPDETAASTPGQPPVMKLVTMTILPNVTVLATGQGTATVHEEVEGYGSVTVAATPFEVELLAFAQNQGELTLALRNRDDMSGMTDIPSVDFDSLARQKREATAEREKRLRPQIIRGAEREEP